MGNQLAKVKTGEITTVALSQKLVQIYKETKIDLRRGTTTAILAVLDKEDDKNLPLAIIIKDQGEEVCKMLLVMAVADLCKAFNISGNMSEEQVYMTAEMIMDDFKYFKIADIRLVFDLIKKGNYGKIYDRLDPALVMSILHHYAAEREQAVINRHENEVVQLKARTGSPNRTNERLDSKDEQFKQMKIDTLIKQAKEKSKIIPND
jgi:hypothetical protein